jgi:hypothetical protein
VSLLNFILQNGGAGEIVRLPGGVSANNLANSVAAAAPANEAKNAAIMNDPLQRFTRDMFGMYRMNRPNRQGVGVLGHDYVDELQKDPSAQGGKYMPQPGEDFNSWVRRVDADFNGFANSVGRDPTMAAKFAEAQKLGGSAASGTPQAQTDQNVTDTRNALDVFVKSLNTPMSENDPRIEQIRNLTLSATDKMARSRGIQGPLSAHAYQGQLSQGLLGLEAHRQSQYGAGLQGLLGADANIANMAYGREMDQYQMNYDRALQQHASGSNMGRTIGTIGGGILGGLASLIPGVGWAAAPALISGGAALGGGIGGAAGGGAGPTMPQMPRRFLGA